MRRGTPVLAVADGTVLLSVYEYGESHYGRNILIEHAGGFQTRYAMLDTVLVQKDAVVKSGERIGLVGDSGRSTGCHLHFELIKDGEHVNPEMFIEF